MCRAQSWHDLVTGVLNLVDIALTANLVLIVIFSGYENFIRRIDAADHPDWPEGLIQVDFGALKQKLLGSIVGIAAVDALAWYFDLEKDSGHLEARLGAGFPAHVRRRHADARDRRPARRTCANGTKADWRGHPSGEGLLTIPGVNRPLGFRSNRVGLRVCGSPALSCCCLPWLSPAAGCAQQPVLRYPDGGRAGPARHRQCDLRRARRASYGAPVRRVMRWRRRRPMRLPLRLRSRRAGLAMASAPAYGAPALSGDGRTGLRRSRCRRTNGLSGGMMPAQPLPMRRARRCAGSYAPVAYAPASRNGPTRSIPATGCASSCSARTG